MITGRNSSEAIMNRTLASKMGEIVLRAIEAATKLRPHTEATKTAANVPLFSTCIFNKIQGVNYTYISFSHPELYKCTIFDGKSGCMY